MSSTKPTGCGSSVNFTQINGEIHKKMSIDPDFFNKCACEWRSRSPTSVSRCRVQWSITIPSLKETELLHWWKEEKKKEVNCAFKHKRHDRNWLKRLHIEGSRPEWCISSMIYSTGTPFWSETLDIMPNVKIQLITHIHNVTHMDL